MAEENSKQNHYENLTLDRREIEKRKYQGLSVEEIKKKLEGQDYWIKRANDFVSARYRLFDEDYNIENIYNKILTRTFRENDPEFRAFGGTGGEGRLSFSKGGNFRKIRGYVKDYMVNAVKFNKEVPNAYLQLDVWVEKQMLHNPEDIKKLNEEKGINIKNEEIGLKKAKSDLERMLGIELPEPTEVTT